jgi:hypothetical protein
MANASELRTPDEVMTILEEKDIRKFESIKGTIISQINNYFKGEPLTFCIDYHKVSLGRVIPKLEVWLKEKNWSLSVGKSGSSPKNEEYTEITISPIV